MESLLQECLKTYGTLSLDAGTRESWKWWTLPGNGARVNPLTHTKSIDHHLKQTPFQPPHQELSFAAGFSLLAPKTSKLFPNKPPHSSPPPPADFAPKLGNAEQSRL
jgi:hypothetical protein